MAIPHPKNSTEKQAFNKQLRHNMTPAERKVWAIVRNRGCLGLKFRRQRPADIFITDFYCAELLSRISGTKMASAEAYKAEWHAKVSASLGEFQTALGVYIAAKKAYFAAFTEELSARDEHERQVERTMGLVRAAFPKDPAKQNLIFPKAARSAEDEDEEIESAITEG